MSYIKNQLTKLGFSSLEASVYIELLKQGKAKAGVIAKVTKIKRSTIYEILFSLRKKGFINESKEEGVKVFQAESLEVINEFIGKEEAKVKEKKKVYKSIKSTLESFRKKTAIPPEVKIHEGTEGVLSLLLQTLWNKPSKVYVFSDYGSSVGGVTPFTKRRVEEGIHINILSPDTKRAKERKKQDKEFLSKMNLVDAKKYKFPGTIYFTDREVILMAFDEKGETPIAVQITSEKVAQTLKEVFYLASR